MQLKLTKPICFFDLETTGINVAKDRIVELAFLDLPTRFYFLYFRLDIS